LCKLTIIVVLPLYQKEINFVGLLTRKINGRYHGFAVMLYGKPDMNMATLLCGSSRDKMCWIVVGHVGDLE